MKECRLRILLLTILSLRQLRISIILERSEEEKTSSTESSLCPVVVTVAPPVRERWVTSQDEEQLQQIAVSSALIVLGSDEEVRAMDPSEYK